MIDDQIEVQAQADQGIALLQAKYSKHLPECLLPQD